MFLSKYLTLLSVTLTLTFFTLTRLTVQSESIYHDSSKHYQERFITNFRQIHHKFRHFTTNILSPVFEEFVTKTNISEKCQQTLRIFLANPNREWAAKSEFSTFNFANLFLTNFRC